MNIVECGFYIVDDNFFRKYDDPYLKGNKQENRPHYYALRDSKTGLHWLIPISPRYQKYKTIVGRRLSQGRKCDILHIVKTILALIRKGVKFSPTQPNVLEIEQHLLVEIIEQEVAITTDAD